MAKTLLVTDDAMIIRQIIKDMAAGAGWEVVGEASNGQEAIDRYRELRPDVVTLDLVMPEHDGLHALHGIMDFDPQAKVLVVSALEQRGVLKDAFKAGAAVRIVLGRDGAAVVFDNIVGQTQTQTGSLALLLGGEKRVEKIWQGFLGDAGPGVRDFDAGSISVGMSRGLQGQGSLAVHGLGGVQDNVHEQMV